MPNYRFKVRDGAGAEKLAAAVLADDDEAIAFARRVMTALVRHEADRYITGSMEIIGGKRSVATMPFEVGS
jgi:hypothetical protein